MSLKKHRLRALCLCIMAALGLMVVNASFAQASWLESNALLGNVLKNFTGEVDLLISLEVPSLKSEIDCTEFDVKTGVVLGNGHPNGSNVAHLEILYKTCDAYTWLVGHANGEKLDLLLDGPCELYETLLDREMRENEGNLLAKFLATVFLHTDGKAYIRMEGTLEAGEIFARIWTRNCLALPNGTKKSGKVVAELHEGAGTNRVQQLVTVANLSLFPNELKYGLNEGKLLGSIWVKLQSGNAWGIC